MNAIFLLVKKIADNIYHLETVAIELKRNFREAAVFNIISGSRSSTKCHSEINKH